MKVNYNLIPLRREDFEEWRRREGLEVEVRERDPKKSLKGAPRFYAILDAEIRDGMMLVSAMGEGGTPEEAILDLARRVEGQPLVLRAGGRRREIKVPEELEVEL